MGKVKIAEDVIARMAEFAREIPDRFWNIDSMELLLDKLYDAAGLLEKNNAGGTRPFHFSIDKSEMLTQVQNAIEYLTKQFGRRPNADQIAILHKLNVYKNGLLNYLRKK